MNEVYKKTVLYGLQRLIALRLKGHPPADTTRQVAEIWLDALQSCGIWSDERHINALATAFRAAEQTLDHFPAPVEIRRLKPPVVDDKPTLPPPKPTEQQRQEIDKIFADIFNTLSINNEENKNDKKINQNN
ncbi:MAG: hypothetical protein KGV56_00245 [Gammaproteobacteria bacterium]|nr:hypothetical protein [Gammaproteobacteria bacterium]